MCVSALLPALLGACTAHPDLRLALESYDPAKRIRAAKAIARSRDQRYIPALVDRLDDEDVAVRFAAIAALNDLTGERLGYDCWAAPDDRRKAIDAWRAYIREHAASSTTTARADKPR